MLRQVRGLGKLARAEGSTKFVAQVILPTAMTADVKPGQNATIATCGTAESSFYTIVCDQRKGPVANGHVIRVGSYISSDARTVEIALDTVPEQVSLEIEATIDIEKIDSVLQVGRPVHGAQNAEIPLFKIVNNGADAVRVSVKLGRASVNTIEVLTGLKEGDRIILSDMSQFESADRIHLTDEQHVLKQ